MDVSTQTVQRPVRFGRAIEVRPVASRLDRRRFLEFSSRIYAADPCWVPPLLLERKQFLDPRKHPFYQHGAAQQFLAWRGNEPVGRILASDDPLYNAKHDDSVGCFGMFESIEDPEVADALLDAAAEWMTTRGRTRIMGPINYSTNYECGLLIDGFDTPPRVMMNHNPPYYRGLLESWGLVKAKDLYAWWFDRIDNQIDASWRSRVERVAARGGVTVRPLRLNDLQAEVLRLQTIFNEAWKDNWGGVPMTEAEFQSMARELVHFAKPELMLLSEVEGQAVGFSLSLPDFNEAIRGINGRLCRFGLPVGLWKLWRGLKRIKTCRLLALGVLDGFRRRGVAELLILRTFDHGRDGLGYTGAELSWTLEDNALVNRTIEAVGGRRYKTYRIFDRDLASG
jgi:GNAT superfamily N-acetyltransferase